MIVQACLNGARSRGYHPRLPTDAKALAVDAPEAVAAGAGEVHLHVRGPDGAESLAPEQLDATVAALRTRVPGTLIGVSTGAWIERDYDRRLACIAGWRELPDYASVNMSEAGAPGVVELLRRRGIGVEAGLACAADAERLVRLGLDRLAMRYLIEIGEQDLGGAMAVADEVLAVLSRVGARRPVLLHGFEATVWPFVERAARDGLSTRVGLEDGAVLPGGGTAGSNAELVAAAVAVFGRARSGVPSKGRA